MKVILNTEFLDMLLSLEKEEQALVFYFANNLILDTSEFTVSDFTKIMIDVKCGIDLKSIDSILNSLVKKGVIKRLNEYWYQFSGDLFFKSNVRESTSPPRIYSLQYDTREWRQRRNEIMKRDDCTCVKCGERGEHVHHKVYFKGCAVWEYADEYLETLCKECHSKIHSVYSAKDLVSKEVVEKYQFKLNPPRIEVDVSTHVRLTYQKMFMDCYVHNTINESTFHRLEVIASTIKGVELERLKQDMKDKVAEMLRVKEQKALRKSKKEAKKLLPLMPKVIKPPKSGSKALKKLKDEERKAKRLKKKEDVNLE